MYAHVHVLCAPTPILPNHRCTPLDTRTKGRLHMHAHAHTHTPGAGVGWPGTRAGGLAGPSSPPPAPPARLRAARPPGCPANEHGMCMACGRDMACVRGHQVALQARMCVCVGVGATVMRGEQGPVSCSPSIGMCDCLVVCEAGGKQGAANKTSSQ